jgi:preprotein translocase subunit YajC
LFAWLIVSLSFTAFLVVVIIAQFFYFARIIRARKQVLEQNLKV